MDKNDRYLHRELSWLELTGESLEEPKDETVPLLERVKFLAIFSSNLDEFFMVRVARKRQVKKGLRSFAADGLTSAETLTAISNVPMSSPKNSISVSSIPYFRNLPLKAFTWFDRKK